jgi:hypothetical protein
VLQVIGGLRVKDFVGFSGSSGGGGRILLTKTPGEERCNECHEKYDSALFQV